MSETLTTETPADPQYGEPAVKSETTQPVPTSDVEPPDKEPDAKPETAPEPKAEEKVKPKSRDWREDRLRQQNARISHESRRADTAEQELATYKSNAEQPQQPQQPSQPTRQDFDRAVQAQAVEVAERTAFTNECNEVANQGAKEFGTKFQESLNTLWEATEGQDSNGLTKQAISLIEAAIETEKPAAVLFYLGQNPEEAIRIAAMKSEAKRGAAVARVAARLETAATAVKPVSKAPAPLEPVSGSARAEVGDMGPKDTAAWFKWREEGIKKSRA